MEKHLTVVNNNVFTMLQTLSEPQRAIALFNHSRQCHDTLPDIVSNHDLHPTIQNLKNTYGNGPVKMCLVMIIEDCVRSLNIKEPSKEQVLEIADELITDNPTLKIQEFKIFFKNYKKGIYGVDYHRFDIATIYIALSKYKDQREEVFEETMKEKNRMLNIQEPIRNKDNKPISELMQELYEKDKEEYEKDKINFHKLEALKNEAAIQWEKNKTEYYKQNPDADKLYYDMNYQKGDYIKWYVKKHLTN